MTRRRWTRRELGALAGSVVMAGAAGAQPGFPIRRPGVVGVSRLGCDDKGRVDPAAARDAMSRALVAATGADDVGTAVAGLFRPTDVVGVKLNCLAGRRMSPRPDVVAALVAHLNQGGVRSENIILFERSSRELERAGFTLQTGRRAPRCIGTDNGYDPMPTESGAIGSCYAKLVSETCTALVSFGVVKDHDLAGVSAGMKNWYGVIHNPNKYHDNQCDPYVADVMRHPMIADKLRLTVLDGVTAQCHGGPAYRASGVFPLGRLSVSTDPVAADVWAWKTIDDERRRRGMPTLEEAGRPPRFIATAASYGLGVGDPASLVEVEG